MRIAALTTRPTRLGYSEERKKRIILCVHCNFSLDSSSFHQLFSWYPSSYFMSVQTFSSFRALCIESQQEKFLISWKNQCRHSYLITTRKWKKRKNPICMNAKNAKWYSEENGHWNGIETSCIQFQDVQTAAKCYLQKVSFSL